MEAHNTNHEDITKSYILSIYSLRGNTCLEVIAFKSTPSKRAGI